MPMNRPRSVITRRVALRTLTVIPSAIVFGCGNVISPTTSDSEMTDAVSEGIEITIPILIRMREVGDLIDSRFPPRSFGGMGQVGLLLSSKLKNGGYWCTPKNSLEFAGTGGDGVHFSLVEVDGVVSENSPVVMSVPANSGDPSVANAIVGDSLINFLRFGLLRGYFAMEQLVYQRDLALKVYSSVDWQPTEQNHYSVGFHVDETKQKILQLIARELNVTPLGYSIPEFEALQKQYMPLLR